MTLEQLRIEMNQLGRKREPFLAVTDFDGEQCLIWKLSEIPKEVQYNFSGVQQASQITSSITSKSPIPFDQYEKAFDNVAQHLHRGDTYLVNLTAPTPITINVSEHSEHPPLNPPLLSFYHSASARYKVFVENQFAFFSPESFVKIEDNRISSFPMKGTINADIPNAKETILNDPKEVAEHNTIVDLIRNDLSIVSSNVTVPRFRYIDEVTTHRGKLLQVSSEICGELHSNWHTEIGDIITQLLPAGSICGAPKKKTVEVIHESEVDSRGYYTGVTVLFDGNSVDSCVNIRFIEQSDHKKSDHKKSDHKKSGNNKECNDQFKYRSGGGITAQSNPHDEYNELLEKIYVPSC